MKTTFQLNPYAIYYTILVFFIYILPLHYIKAQKIDANALNLLTSSIKTIETQNSLSYSMFYSFSRGNEKNVHIDEMGASYIYQLNKDSIIYYLPSSSNIRLETKDSIYQYFYNPTEYTSVLAKKDYHTHGAYNIEKISINDLLPKMTHLNSEFIDSIAYHKIQSHDEYIVDIIYKPRDYNNGSIRSKKSYDRYWINKKTLIPFKRQRFSHFVNDLSEEDIQIDDFSISFPERNPAPNIPLDIFKNNALRDINIEESKEHLIEKESSIGLIKKGLIAPNFSAKDISSQLEEDLSNYKGKVILLDFWYLSCAPCRQLMPILNNLNKKYKDRDFVLIGVNFHDTKSSNIKSYIDKMSYSYKQWYLPSEEIKFYGITAAPTTILIDKSGKIVFVEEGFYDDIEQSLTQLINQELKK